MIWNWVPQVYIYRDYIDFRKSINGLVLIIEQELSLSPMSGAVFVFCNRKRDKLKMVYWDKTGFCLWYKRLEEQRFYWPKGASAEIVEWSSEQLEWLLRGLDVTQMKGHQPLNYLSTGS